MKKILIAVCILALALAFAPFSANAATYTLTVASSNPSSGVAITVSPNDLNGRNNGTTQFTRSYSSTTSISLTAPETASGNTFQKWQRDGSDYSTNRTITFTLSSNRTMKAVFVTSAASNYNVIATNDLGMHCACPTFEGFLLLPPFNTIRVQVLKRGNDSVTAVSSGITVNYSLAEETDASLQADPYFSSWIVNSPKIFPGFQPVVGGKVMGITGNGITGTATYDSQSMSWIASGIPAYPVVTGNPSKDIMPDPLGGPKRDPYLTANITVKDTAGTVLGTTSTVVPVAIGGCCTCHLPLAQQNGYPATPAGSFAYLGKLHGQNASHIDFSYIDPDGDGKGGPIRCSWCHWDPAMGELTAAPGIAAVWPNYTILPGATFTKAQVVKSSRSFSDVLHKFHTQNQKVLTQFDANIAKNCYDCHPEPTSVVCYRGVHKTKGLWCTDCHGDLNKRVSTNQLLQPWKASTLPSCYKPSTGVTSNFACHASVPETVWDPGLFGKFINARGGMGSHKVLCESCHGSVHAENPSTQPLDNVQNAAIHDRLGTTFPAGKDKTYALGSCKICHTNESSTWSPNVMYGN